MGQNNISKIDEKNGFQDLKLGSNVYSYGEFEFLPMDAFSRKYPMPGISGFTLVKADHKYASGFRKSVYFHFVSLDGLDEYIYDGKKYTHIGDSEIYYIKVEAYKESIYGIEVICQYDPDIITSLKEYFGPPLNNQHHIWKEKHSDSEQWNWKSQKASLRVTQTVYKERQSEEAEDYISLYFKSSEREELIKNIEHLRKEEKSEKIKKDF
ncbi:hypothetical protein [Xanthocytophaga agilis]|uniref:Uncharacterized protein n=1 Tax=Xanthocytophaga agilis TaxID=3048010 RepID=A0AAE3RBF9_9BACT|nr:hypothetical protein [Xanthocytophaga agilis]MDJ1506840.1 hypothetical protein [Xanthocytophaga agilis]